MTSLKDHNNISEQTITINLTIFMCFHVQTIKHLQNANILKVIIVAQLNLKYAHLIVLFWIEKL